MQLQPDIRRYWDLDWSKQQNIREKTKTFVRPGHRDYRVRGVFKYLYNRYCGNSSCILCTGHPTWSEIYINRTVYAEDEDRAKQIAIDKEIWNQAGLMTHDLIDYHWIGGVEVEEINITEQETHK